MAWGDTTAGLYAKKKALTDPLATAAAGSATRTNPWVNPTIAKAATPPSNPYPAPSAPPVTGSDTGASTTKPAAATVQAPGAPPGVPDTGAAIPLIPKDEQAIQYANQDYGTAVAGLNQGMGQAAFRYGDPTQMARFGVGSVNPNSELALAALRAQQQQEAATNLRGDQNTLFSSLALNDASRIGATQQRADLAGNTRYQAALAKFNAAMLGAQTARDRAITDARTDERNQALANMVTPATVTATATPGAPDAATAPVAAGAPGPAKGISGAGIIQTVPRVPVTAGPINAPGTMWATAARKFGR